MPALQKGAAWGKERLLGALRRSVPQNGRVHLHILERTAAQTWKSAKKIKAENLARNPWGTLR